MAEKKIYALTAATVQSANTNQQVQDTPVGKKRQVPAWQTESTIIALASTLNTMQLLYESFEDEFFAKSTASESAIEAFIRDRLSLYHDAYGLVMDSLKKTLKDLKEANHID